MTDEATYSRLARKQQSSKEIKDLQDRLDSMKKQALYHIASIPEGRIFLHLLMNECGFHEPSIVQHFQTGEINDKALLVNEAIRGLYVRIRNMIPQDRLKDIEFLNLKEAARDMVAEINEEGDGK